MITDLLFGVLHFVYSVFHRASNSSPSAVEFCVWHINRLLIIYGMFTWSRFRFSCRGR